MRCDHLLWLHVLRIGYLLALFVKLVPFVKIWMPWNHVTQQTPISSSNCSPKSTAETYEPKQRQHRQQSDNKQDIDFLRLTSQYTPCREDPI